MVGCEGSRRLGVIARSMCLKTMALDSLQADERWYPSQDRRTCSWLLAGMPETTRRSPVTVINTESGKAIMASLASCAACAVPETRVRKLRRRHTARSLLTPLGLNLLKLKQNNLAVFSNGR
jgi:hypothetical protein